MAIDDIMIKVQAWTVGCEALAAVGAKLSLQPGDNVPPAVRQALDNVTSAAGMDEVAELPPPQRAMVLGLIRLVARQMIDVLDEPVREPEWTFTHPDILDGWGRGSAMVPMMIAAAHPDLASTTSFLDVGTGVGLLACAAASVWPGANIVGIDPWTPSLDRARDNISSAGLTDRIQLRQQRAEDLTEVDAYDCAWVPTFFLNDDALDAAIPKVVASVRPDGWIVLGRMRMPPDPLVAGLVDFRITRAGGSNLDHKRSAALLEEHGCTVVEPVAPPPMVPLELVLGRKQSAA